MHAAIQLPNLETTTVGMVALGLIGGFVLLVLGGESLVRGSVALARRIGVSPLLIGLTLVGFGTSTPELVTSLEASFVGSPGIAVGNIIGSNIANILLILGLAAVIRPVRARPEAFYRDGSMLALSTLACVALCLAGVVGGLAGTVLISLLVAYLVFTYWKERTQPDASAAMHASEAESIAPAIRSVWLSLLFAIGGITLTILGARLLVDNAVVLARSVDVSEAIIGLTIVAVGTSLPELVTSVLASWRNQSDVALGNVVGSNIFNVLGVLGITAMVQPLVVPVQILDLDLWVMLGSTALLLAFAVTGWRLTRIEGLIFLGSYAAYLAWLGNAAT
jgi:cation:H+ antiporter